MAKISVIMPVYNAENYLATSDVISATTVRIRSSVPNR